MFYGDFGSWSCVVEVGSIGLVYLSVTDYKTGCFNKK